MELAGCFPVSLQDIDFTGDAPDTVCLANFQLSLWDEDSKVRRTGIFVETTA